MDKFLEIVKMILKFFVRITAVVTVATASYITVFYGAGTEIQVGLLWQILIVSLLTALCPLLFYNRENHELGRRAFWFRCALCYVYVNLVVLGMGCKFEWFDPSDPVMVLGMLIAILLVFVIVWLSPFLLDLKTTNQINQKLRERGK